MSLNFAFTPLEAVGMLSAEQRETLCRAGIKAVEPLVGLLVSNPAQIGEMIHLGPEAVEDLRYAALAALPPSERDGLNHKNGRTHPFGALDPRLKDKRER